MVFLIVLFFSMAMAQAIPGIPQGNITQYNIDLAAPPETRWSQGTSSTKFHFFHFFFQFSRLHIFKEN
jgi:hypothetical protein